MMFQTQLNQDGTFDVCFADGDSERHVPRERIRQPQLKQQLLQQGRGRGVGRGRTEEKDRGLTPRDNYSKK